MYIMLRIVNTVIIYNTLAVSYYTMLHHLMLHYTLSCYILL